MEKEWIGSITSWMVSPSKDTITKHGIFVYMLKWFCSAEHVHVTCLTWPHSETRLVWMVSNQPSLMEALLRGGEEGNRILILGWLCWNQEKLQMPDIHFLQWSKSSGYCGSFLVWNPHAPLAKNRSGKVRWDEFLTDCKLRLQDGLTVT